MFNHSTGRRLLAAGILLAASAAHADSPHRTPTDRVEYRADGTVHLGGQVFANREAYYRSPAFRESGARCGNHDHVPSPAALIAPSDCALNKTTINSDYSDNRTLVIQVVFHVIQRTDGRGAISPALIQSQMDILNEDFNALAGTPGSMGSNAQLQFVLAKFDPQGNPTTGINVVTSNQYFNDPGSSGGNPMKRAINWDPARYLNIYTNDAAGLLGYATFPAEDDPRNPYDGAGGAEDGVVLLWDAVGRNAPAGAPYNQGRTATHEIGHYLGLYHTFENIWGRACAQPNAPYSVGDLIADTQPHSVPQFDCPIQAAECGGGNAPAENYMNYTDDTCMTKFTVEQVNRMRCSIVNYRTVNTPPVAAFTVSTSKLDATFSNTSSDAESPAAELHYKWTFGDGETSTEANPTHTYAADGTYQVTLEVVDPGSGTTTKTESVSVTATPVTPDAGPDGGTGGTEDGGGCCQAPGGELSALLCGIPVLLVLGRRRRRA